MPARPSLTIEEVLGVLSDMPGRIAALTAGLTPDQLRARPSPDEWSANEVLGHLRANSDVWGANIMAILTQDTPKLRRVSPRAWMRKSNYSDLEFAASFSAYGSQRRELLAALEDLSPDGWTRSATVRGPARETLERSVFSYADALARHEQQHIGQVESIVETVRRRPTDHRGPP